MDGEVHFQYLPYNIFDYVYLTVIGGAAIALCASSWLEVMLFTRIYKNILN